ncbi:MAG: amidohydrolase family protein [Pseudomonadota bacterium]
MPNRAYNVIDADGHVLEPFTLWQDYMDPAFRDRAPKLVTDKDGKQKLLLEEKILGSRAGFGGIGGVGARQGTVKAEAMAYEDGRKGGFDPHARIPDMDLDGIDAAFLYPSLGLFAGAVDDPAFAAAMCRAYNNGWPITASLIPTGCSESPMLPMQSIDAAIGEMRFAREQLGFRGGFLRPNPYHDRKLHDPAYAPFWSAAEELDFAIGPARGRQQRHADGRHRSLRWAGRPSTSSRTPWR